MKNRLFHKIRHPLLLETSLVRRWFTCLVFAFFVFAFLAVFQPFGLSKLPQGLWFVTFGYELTTFIVMVIMNIFFMPLFPVFFSEEKWTVGRELIWSVLNILAIGFGNAIYTSFIGIGTFSLSSIVWFMFYTFAVGVFPVSILILMKEAGLKKKFKRQSGQMNESIQGLQNSGILNKDENKGVLIAILSENQHEELKLMLSDLIYIKSSDNYMEVYYLQNNKVERNVIRNSLKSIEENLSGHKQLMRCHKSYLVNLEKVNCVSGNARGYKLHLSGSDIRIPVSRQYNDFIKKRLTV